MNTHTHNTHTEIDEVISFASGIPGEIVTVEWSEGGAMLLHRTCGDKTRVTRAFPINPLEPRVETRAL